MHSLVHHQSKLDSRWYRRTLASLDKYTSLIPNRYEGVQRENLVAALFAEILAVVASSHMLHVALLCLGEKEIPPLPKLPSHSSSSNSTGLQPTYTDIVSAGLLKEECTFRCNPKVVHAPYVLSQDFDVSSHAWQELPADVQQYLLDNLGTHHPLLALSVAPRSLCLCVSMATEISFSDRPVVVPWNDLDHSVQDLTRSDRETLFLASAEAYGTVA